MFGLWHSREGPRRGQAQRPLRCSHTPPAREETPAVSPETQPAGGLLQKKTRGDKEEEDKQLRELV